MYNSFSRTKDVIDPIKDIPAANVLMCKAIRKFIPEYLEAKFSGWASDGFPK